MRFGLKESGVFDLWDIPELQDSEDRRIGLKSASKRDIAEINAGLKTINDVLKERDKDTKPWGDVELIASVPFCLAAESEAADRSAAIPDGIAWTLSTFDLDRFGERIDPAGWDYKRYMENPVVEWAHCYDIPAIGKKRGYDR